MKMNPEAVNHKKDLQEAAGRLHKVACVAGAQGATLLKQAPWGKMAKVVGLIVTVAIAATVACLQFFVAIAALYAEATTGSDACSDAEEVLEESGVWMSSDGRYDTYDNGGMKIS
jgi:hypothetical protein